MLSITHPSPFKSKKTLDSIPPSLTRSLSDLKELDAVLNTPLRQVHTLLDRLLGSILNPESMKPDQRLTLLRSIVGEIEKYKLGGDDKIRVANGTCESVSEVFFETLNQFISSQTDL